METRRGRWRITRGKKAAACARTGDAEVLSALPTDAYELKIRGDGKEMASRLTAVFMCIEYGVSTE